MANIYTDACQDDAMMNWATSVRVALSNEPARQWFSNQIKDGYQFLDNFLDSHLVTHGLNVPQTPMRRDASQRVQGKKLPQASSSQRDSGKENHAPVPARALYPVSEDNETAYPTKSLPSPPASQNTGTVEQHGHNARTTVSETQQAPAIVIRRPAPATSTQAIEPETQEPKRSFPPATSIQELSAIVESSVDDGNAPARPAGGSPLHILDSGALSSAAASSAGQPATEDPMTRQDSAKPHPPSLTNQITDVGTMQGASHALQGSHSSEVDAGQDDTRIQPVLNYATRTPGYRSSNVATNPTILNGKRTSWLQKGRDYAAAKRSIAPLPNPEPLASRDDNLVNKLSTEPTLGKKRKSEHALDQMDMSADRATKSARLADVGISVERTEAERRALESANRAVEEERQRKAAQEAEEQRLRLVEEERQRRVAEEERERKAAEERERLALEEQERQRVLAEEERRRKQAEVERQRKVLEEEKQRKAAEEERQRKADEDERLRKVEEEERRRKATEEDERRRKVMEAERERQEAEEAERQRKAAEEKERQRKLLKEECERRAAEEMERQRKAAEEERQHRLAEEQQQQKAAEEEARRTLIAEEARKRQEKEQSRIEADRLEHERRVEMEREEASRLQREQEEEQDRRVQSSELRSTRTQSQDGKAISRESRLSVSELSFPSHSRTETRNTNGTTTPDNSPPRPVLTQQHLPPANAVFQPKPYNKVFTAASTSKARPGDTSTGPFSSAFKDVFTKTAVSNVFSKPPPLRTITRTEPSGEQRAPHRPAPAQSSQTSIASATLVAPSWIPQAEIHDQRAGFEDDSQASWLNDDDVDDSQVWKTLGFPEAIGTGDTWSTNNTTRKIELLKSKTSRDEVREDNRTAPQDDIQAHLPQAETGDEVTDDVEEDERAVNELAKQAAAEPIDVEQGGAPSNFIVDGAARLFTSVFGGKKPTQNVQRAAAIAKKKEEEEKEKKAARLRNQETRRIVAAQRKADEEKARLEDEQKRAKEDMERRKREREDNTDKRPLKAPTKKAVDDDTKRRKLAAEPEKKIQHKKQPSKDLQTAAGRGLPKLKPGHVKQPSVTKVAMIGSSSSQPVAGSSSTNIADAARSKTPALAPPPPKPHERSENVELPDIASDYSDSDDDERNAKKAAQPDWVHSPAVRDALVRQGAVNPEGIFGEVQELHMEDIFRGRASRFRARTSSANWTGSDRLTFEEEETYAARMGYHR